MLAPSTLTLSSTEDGDERITFPSHSMADYMKLFLDRRLTANEPHHLEHIKGRLAAMKAEGDQRYAEYSAHYGVDVAVEVTKEPEVKEEKKRRGRPKAV